jgi:hypothetical protein
MRWGTTREYRVTKVFALDLVSLCCYGWPSITLRPCTGTHHPPCTVRMPSDVPLHLLCRASQHCMHSQVRPPPPLPHMGHPPPPPPSPLCTQASPIWPCAVYAALVRAQSRCLAFATLTHGGSVRGSPSGRGRCVWLGGSSGWYDVHSSNTRRVLPLISFVHTLHNIPDPIPNSEDKMQ